MTFWRNVLPNMLLHGQNALLVVSTCLQNFYQCRVVMTTFYYYSVNHQSNQSSLSKNTFSKSTSTQNFKSFARGNSHYERIAQNERQF